MSSPTVSAVVPVGWPARYLAVALATVAAEGDVIDELVVVDDGPHDEVPGIVEQVPGLPRTVLVRQARAGGAAARNAAIRASSGAVIAPLDADDLWVPGRTRRLLAHLPPGGVVAGAVRQFDQDPTAPPLDVSAALAVAERAVTTRLATTMLITREAWEAVGPYDEVISVGDVVDWAARAEDHAAVPTALIDDVVLLRRRHGANTVIRERAQYGDYAKVLKAALDRRRAARLTAGADERPHAD